jgi:hypothetical protein
MNRITHKFDSSTLLAGGGSLTMVEWHSIPMTRPYQTTDLREDWINKCG